MLLPRSKRGLHPDVSAPEADQCTWASFQVQVQRESEFGGLALGRRTVVISIMDVCYYVGIGERNIYIDSILSPKR